VNFTTPESRKSRGSNTDSNYTDLSETETYPFPSGQGGGHGQAPVDKMGRDMDEREQYRAILEDNLEYDILLENNPYDRDTIAEVMELLLDTICSKRQYIRIAGDDKPREVSMILTIISVVIFIASLQPYVAFFTFVLLIIKGALLLKRP
jgi:hypothetical protein